MLRNTDGSVWLECGINAANRQERQGAGLPACYQDNEDNTVIENTLCAQAAEAGSVSSIWYTQKRENCHEQLKAAKFT